MKKQCLGDSKDSFKWDFHNHLTNALVFTSLKIVLMLTEDDRTKQGNTDPTLFPARREILSFCEYLRVDRSIGKIRELPVRTRASYKVTIYKPEEIFTHRGRAAYLEGLKANEKELCFFDPDNGFGPHNPNKKHVLYAEVIELLGRSHRNSVVSVFQHFRRISFEKDYGNILQNLGDLYTIAICWHSLMFVLVTKSSDCLKHVKEATRDYATNRPVRIL
jgi:hypothetical protein